MKKRLHFGITFMAAAALLFTTANARAVESVQAARHEGPVELYKVPTEKKATSGLMKQLKAEPVQKVSAKASAEFEGRTVYGTLVNSTEDSWTSSTITDVPYGIYSFAIGDNPVTSAYFTNYMYNFTAGTYFRGKYLGVYTMSMMGVLTGARYYTLDTEAKTQLKEVMYTIDDGYSYELISSAMAYNPVDNKIYSFQYNSDLTGYNWCYYDEEKDKMETICAFLGKYNVLTLAAAPNGEMYFINAYGDLYKIDRNTADPTLVGNTGVSATLYVQAMIYDGMTGTFLWAAQTSTGSALYSVNPETASATLLTTFNNSEQFSSLYLLDNGAKSAAPAGVNDLKLTYDAEGSLSGKITFTTPSSTYGGGTLGASTLNVWLDGVNLKGVSAEAGSSVSIPVTLEEGNHYVSVNLSNDGGYSPMSWVYQYAGYDTPLAVSDVNFTNADGQNTVTWTAPKGGVNDGYIDYANLKYTIVRMPDSVTVAENFVQTTFTEETPAEMHNYSYRVYAVNNCKMGEFSESNSVISGGAFEVPYSQSFSDSSVFTDFFTVVDANNDGNTWRAGYSGDVRIDISSYYYPEGDDWLITPAILLEGGIKYGFTMNMKTFSSGYPEDFELYVGTDPKDLTTFTMFDKQTGFELYQEFGDYTAYVNIENAGKYYFAVRYISKAANNGTMVLINSVSVTKLGSSQAPAAVSDLVVTPGSDDAMEATISFVAPSKNLNDETLTSISKISIYRNGGTDALYVFENPTPGASLSWTDKAVEVAGVNTYSVVAENEYGAGQSAEASAFVSVYTTPYTATFDTRADSELFTATLTGVDATGWSYQSSYQRMNFYAYIFQENVVADGWLYTPMIKLDANSVYTLSYKTNINLYTTTITNKVYMGTASEPSAQTTFVGDMPTSTSYQMKEVSHQVITSEAGKYCIGFNSRGTALYDYMSVDLDDISLTYLKSALCPYEFTDYSSVADANGELKATLKFKAPSVNYKGENLTENMKIEVFRGQGITPVYSAENVAPGTAIEWLDEQALKGKNAYMLVATNSYGRSEELLDTLYVGKDIPTGVSNFAIKGSADNMDAVLSWEAPTVGINGGVIVPDDLSYTVMSVEIDATAGTAIPSVIAENVKGNTYTVQNVGTSTQQVLYYAVAPVTNEGVGSVAMNQVTIGKLYEMPFTESFANVSLSTTPWLISTENSSAYTWGVTNPDGSTYNSATAQDDDGGVAYMYNGSYYETFAGAGLLSPKVAVGSGSNELTFWVYNIKSVYSVMPVVEVYVRPDDGDYVLAGSFTVGNAESEDGWKQYSISLDDYASNNYVSFAFYGYTCGYSEVIYLDNIKISTVSGVDATGIDNKVVDHVNYYNISGVEVINPENGIYISKTTYTDGTSKSEKVVIK